MKVNVIRAEDPDMVMKMSLNGFHDQNTLDFFKSQYNNLMDRMEPHAVQFVNTVKNVYNYITNNNVIDSAKRLLTRVDNTITNDRIIQYVNPVNIHDPGMTMRRYIMALPELYDTYNKNLCSGYEDEWERPEPDTKSIWRDDYLHVIDGEVGDEFTIFYEDENPLSTRERFMVSDAWDTVKVLMANGIDPTNFDEEGEL